jgi:hypothetical protein
MDPFPFDFAQGLAFGLGKNAQDDRFVGIGSRPTTND